MKIPFFSEYFSNLGAELIAMQKLNFIIKGMTEMATKQDLLNALKLSNIFSDKFNQVNLAIKPKEKVFELSSNNNDVGENKTFLDAAVTGETVELSFNYKYFLVLILAAGINHYFKSVYFYLPA